MSTAVAQPAQGEAEVVVDLAANSASNASGKDSWVQQTGRLLISNLLRGHAAPQRYLTRPEKAISTSSKTIGQAHPSEGGHDLLNVISHPRLLPSHHNVHSRRRHPPHHSKRSSEQAARILEKHKRSRRVEAIGNLTTPLSPGFSLYSVGTSTGLGKPKAPSSKSAPQAQAQVSDGGHRRLLNPDFLPSTILGSESMRCSPAIAFNHNHAGRPPPLGLSFWLHQAASSGVDRREAVIRVSRKILGQAQAQPAEGRCQPGLCSPSLLSTSHHGVRSRSCVLAQHLASSLSA